jgi:Zn-dependent M28 family amino/carboxypeptidase
MIERLWQHVDAWGEVRDYFNSERVVQQKYVMPVFIWQSSRVTEVSTSQASLHTEGNKSVVVPAKNVMGLVQGTDAKLKEQYILLSAHYDHIGVTSQPKQTDGRSDSIYNGTRDNAIGVTAVMNAAKYFAKHPPKRSVIFVLFTGEEIGLLGSGYFAAHPPVPLNKIVYNLNCDNGGYNDTSVVTVVGLGRTSADDDIKKAASAYGVTAIPDPVPELNLFDRSDNVNFALHGIPSPTYSMGITSFDSVILKNYHQLSDELGTFNLDYGLKYVRSYILSASNVANNPEQPAWVKDDKYEAAWKKLYQRK